MRGEDEKFGTFFVETDGACGEVGDDSQNTDDSVNGRGLEVDGVLCHVRIPMENAVARAVMRVVAHVMVKSGLLDFCGLILIVSVFNIVVFEAMEMRVMGCHLGEVGIGGAPERLWENEAERNATSGGLAFGLVHSGWREGGWESGRGEGCQKAMDVWDGGKRCGERLELSGKRAVVLFKNPTDLRASRSKRPWWVPLRYRIDSVPCRLLKFVNNGWIKTRQGP